jgi:hypothetical protein
MVVSGDVRAPAALPPEKMSPVPIGYEAGYLIVTLYSALIHRPYIFLIVEYPAELKLGQHVVYLTICSLAP